MQEIELGKLEREVLKVMIELYEKESDYLLGGARTRKGVKEELKRRGYSPNYLYRVDSILKFLYEAGFLERLIPKNIYEICEEVCDAVPLRVRSCFKRGKCEKNIYPPILMQELNSAIASTTSAKRKHLRPVIYKPKF